MTVPASTNLGRLVQTVNILSIFHLSFHHCGKGNLWKNVLKDNKQAFDLFGSKKREVWSRVYELLGLGEMRTWSLCLHRRYFQPFLTSRQLIITKLYYRWRLTSPTPPGTRKYVIVKYTPTLTLAQRILPKWLLAILDRLKYRLLRDFF